MLTIIVISLIYNGVMALQMSKESMRSQRSYTRAPRKGAF
jgi:hypothetical protein